MEVHLWEAGILLVGVSFVIVAIYIAKTLNNFAKVVQEIGLMVLDNKKNINEILKDVQRSTKSLSLVIEDVQETVESLKKSMLSVEKTVSSTKNYLLTPILKTLHLTHSVIKVLNSLTKKNKK